MMEAVVKAAWALLAAIHAAPAAALIAPAALRSLYGIEPDGDLGVLMEHRGALFLALVVLCLYALVDPASRRGAGLALAISIAGFLLVYMRAGLPSGALRTIAVVDAVALVPLVIVLGDAWLNGPA